MSLKALYTENAHRCASLADRTDDLLTRDSLTQAAQSWRMLAEIEGRVERQTFAIAAGAFLNGPADFPPKRERCPACGAELS